MTGLNPSALALSRALLRILRVLNLIYVAGIALLLAGSLVAAGTFFHAIGFRVAVDNQALMLGLRVIMVAGIAAAGLTHVVLGRLLAIVDSVRAGDPFIAVNARHLQAIAWCVLVLELLRLGIGAIAAGVQKVVPSFDVDAGFSFAPWLTVLLLFVLARVFDHGTRLRADLEGTV